MTGMPQSILPISMPSIAVDVVEKNGTAKTGWSRCVIGHQIKFSTERLENYCFANWQPLIYDALLLAAVVEYCDRSCRRSSVRWGRNIQCRLPVHDVQHWRTPTLIKSLTRALQLLTGDRWTIDFKPRSQPAEAPSQCTMALAHPVSHIVPYSDGLDSRAVSSLLSGTDPQGVIRVRLGTRKNRDPEARQLPFAAVPYAVRSGLHNQESSGRSRGFKFALIGAIAAYLSGCQTVIMPESFQGSLGPVLVPVGQAYEDYRNHPWFSHHMAAFVSALLGQSIQFAYPRLWHTKAQTLRAFTEQKSNVQWQDTRSCWQQSRQVSVDGKRRQCGICAACQLRRMSLFAAGLDDDPSSYVWEDLSASEFKRAVADGFDETRITDSQRQYAIAGVLHMDHLASLKQSPLNAETLDHQVFQLEQVMDLDEQDIRSRLDDVLAQHREEWLSFIGSLKPQSFIKKWIGQL